MVIAAGAEDIPARPTIYKGIQMRSRLEADYAAHLDQTDQEWEYEPQCFASDRGQWLPDFRIGKYRVLTEVKPVGPMGKAAAAGVIEFEQFVDSHLAKMTVAWDSEPEARLQLVYWNYGGPLELVVYSTGRADPWFARTGELGTCPHLLWTGMGQYARLATLAGD